MAQPQPKAGSGGCWIVLGVIGLLVLVGMCSSPEREATQSFASPSLSEQIETMPSPTMTAVAALDAVSVRKAQGHLAAVIAAEGLPGAMIYSQNCYDALSREFTWGKLDQCGGFDLLAVRSLETTSAVAVGVDTELGYFGAEEAAGRYLAVATRSGEEAGDADVRLQQLQRLVDRLAPVPAVETPVPHTVDPDEGDEDLPREVGVEEGAA